MNKVVPFKGFCQRFINSDGVHNTWLQFSCQNMFGFHQTFIVNDKGLQTVLIGPAPSEQQSIRSVTETVNKVMCLCVCAGGMFVCNMCG